MDLGKQPLQLRLKGLLFRSLVVLAEEMPTGLERVETERQSSHAQILHSSAELPCRPDNLTMLPA